MRFDPVAKLQNLLHGAAFSLAVAAVLVAFNPEQPYAPPLVFSLCIGLLIWAIVDLGRHAFPSARETGWPPGLTGLLLVAGGIAAGLVLGSTLADLVCRTWDLYGPGHLPTRGHALRSSALITLVAGVTGSYYFYSRSRGAWLERQMRESRRQADDARLKLLETQLEPHMLFNTLANLRALIAVDPPRAQQMLDHMIAYLRSTLDASRATTHPLQAEFDRLRDYLELMAVRMGARLSYRLQLPPELAQRAVPTLLLQPLVENAIRHGLEPQVAGGRLDVSARQDGDDLVLDVLDTGAGPGASSATGSGFGLAQVRERLATLYGPAGRLSLEAAQPQGTRVSIRLPLTAP
ncbi:sensor histidine kinase [Ramlibacter sp.]|uniref:sensor histidine kinase n=1 Tax=Ramlibacter sp. TaxID=1917967 RepID=UPI002D4B93CE|nr:histidine kinase [Ramlibacter sp.]HYD76296.1 histidine kinase [Ramlibacter sp.]